MAHRWERPLAAPSITDRRFCSAPQSCYKSLKYKDFILWQNLDLKVHRERRSDALYFLLRYQIGCYSCVMNKHSAAKKRPARPSRRTARKLSPRKAVVRSAPRKPEHKNGVRKSGLRKNGIKNGINIAAIDVSQIGGRETSVSRATVSRVDISAVAVIGSALQAHRFSVGQTVLYTSSPISRPGASGSYRVVRLLPSDGDDYQYRIKHAGEAFERVAKESQLELEG